MSISEYYVQACPRLHWATIDSIVSRLYKSQFTLWRPVIHVTGRGREFGIWTPIASPTL